MSVELGRELSACDIRPNQNFSLPKGQQHDDNDGKDHFDVGPGREAKEAHHAQLHHLTECEEVNLALWTPAYVVIWRVGGLKTEKMCMVGND